MLAKLIIKLAGPDAPNPPNKVIATEFGGTVCLIHLAEYTDNNREIL
jgi:hypothetical protein